MRIAIGDVHGKYSEYQKIIKNAEYSIQVGDFGFDYSIFSINKISCLNHRFITGNHDHHENAVNCPNYYGRYGYSALNEFFYISGAFSIDRSMRTQGIDWFPNEELDFRETDYCIQFYKEVKPKIIISHDCPSFLFNFQSHTSRLLTHLFELNQPDLWIFGHHHVSLRRNIKGTEFKCLNELETFKF